MSIGPVQVVILGFADPDFKGEALAEIDRLRKHDIVRVIDMLVVRKHDNGEIEKLHRSDLGDDAAELGAYVGALMGFGAAGLEGAELGAESGAELMASGETTVLDEETWYLDDKIPPGTAAAIILLEHRWAIPLRETLINANGTLLADAWIHPTDLVAIGLASREEATAAR